MNPELKTTAEITTDAINLLCREIGPVNTARFLGQFSHGTGDYTQDRDTILKEQSVTELVAEIRNRRTQS